MKITKVWPRDEGMLKYLKHPSAGALTDSPAGTSWPRDQFTLRRLREGAITETRPEEPAPPTVRDVKSLEVAQSGLKRRTRRLLERPE